jgi:hypothetical protein
MCKVNKRKEKGGKFYCVQSTNATNISLVAREEKERKKINKVKKRGKM